MLTQEQIPFEFSLPLNCKIEITDHDEYRLFIMGVNGWRAIDKSPYPSFNLLTQRFGANAVNFYAQLGWKGHNGLDLIAPTGCSVHSMFKGTVASYNDVSGTLEVWSEEFTRDNVIWKLRAIYGHLDSISIKSGDKVESGQVIAVSDNKGKYTTGSHLHLTIMPYQLKNGQWLCDRANGYDGGIDFANKLNLVISMPSLVEQLEADKKEKLWLANFFDKHDLQLVQNSVTGEKGWVYNQYLRVPKTLERKVEMIMNYLHRGYTKQGITVEQSVWDRLNKMDF